ncbi:hypothetical protein ACFXAF_21880 [Kitasatospora sp. NPDC059463]|uniref:hypothetical protein n=1 Tax=unclassified Kitasatospora TaxID=2633591 RepID=UPI0036CC4BCB
MTHESADRAAAPVLGTVGAAARVGWGVLGVVLLGWTVFEVAKHTGLTVPLAVLGLLVPWLAVRAPTAPGKAAASGAAAVGRALLRVRIPLAVMVVCSLVPGPADSTAAPFTFGMAWLTHLALRRALGRDPR